MVGRMADTTAERWVVQMVAMVELPSGVTKVAWMVDVMADMMGLN